MSMSVSVSVSEDLSGRTHPFSVRTVGWGLFRVSKIRGYQPSSGMLYCQFRALCLTQEIKPRGGPSANVRSATIASPFKGSDLMSRSANANARFKKVRSSTKGNRSPKLPVRSHGFISLMSLHPLPPLSVPGASTEMDASRAMVSKSNKDKIARSPTPPDTDEDEGDDVEWPVHGIVGEDVDVFGISRFVIMKNGSPTSLLKRLPKKASRQARPLCS